MADKRAFQNPFDDFEPGNENDVIDMSTGKIQNTLLDKFKTTAKSLLDDVERNIGSHNFRDISVYTGASGIAFMYFVLSSKLKNPHYLRRSLELIDKSLQKLSAHSDDISFLLGNSGPLAIGAVLNHSQGRTESAQELVKRVISLSPEVTRVNSDLPDEILYGRAGYLYSLLFLNKHLGAETVDSTIIKGVVSAILQSGQNLAKQEKRKIPLMYKWYGSHYIGAAHGICGILYMLLKAKDYMSRTELTTLVKPTIDFLQSIRYSSRNFPASLSDKSDLLIHWCHGAPGAVFLFTEAYKVFADEEYIKTALDCGEVVWQRGILRKGYSICHGVAGNAYTFLHLYKTTGDLKHLYRACQFANWCCTYGKHQEQRPDSPLSLFEGVSGVIYFLTDVQDPSNANFPVFEL